MEPEFAIPPPTAPAEPAGGEQRLSNKEKRKLKQLEKQQQVEREKQQAEEQARAAAPAVEDAPLSHKEKRQAKKRRLALEAAGEDPDAPQHDAKKSKTASGAASTTPLMIGGTAVGNTPARSSHGVWVGNLNFATHARDLLAWFQARGLAEITRINMPNGKRTHENNRGFAYLDFPTETDVVVAVGLSEQNLDGRKLLIKASTDYTGRPAAPALAALPPLDPSALEPSEPSTSTATATGTGTSAPPQTLNRTARKILNRQKNPAGPTLFLGNLGFETVVDDIRDMFDRNQKRSREWNQKTKGEKKQKKKSSKGKKKREEGQDDESESSSDGEGEEGDSSSEEDSSDEEADEGEGSDGADVDGEDEVGADKAKLKKDRREKKEKGPLDLAKAETAGIRKIRLGTFEDTGKCKGWAFVDFHLPAQATRALLNLHNHSLNGRALNVEYASAEAVRRGGLGTRAASKANGAARARGGDYDDDNGERPARGGDKRKGRDWDDSDVVAAATAASAASGGSGFYDGPPAARRAPRGDGFGGDRGSRRDDRAAKGGRGTERAKPGAALAMAQRASEGIVQSTGKKTTFD